MAQSGTPINTKNYVQRRMGTNHKRLYCHIARGTCCIEHAPLDPSTLPTQSGLATYLAEQVVQCPSREMPLL